MASKRIPICSGTLAATRWLMHRDTRALQAYLGHKNIQHTVRNWLPTGSRWNLLLSSVFAATIQHSAIGVRRLKLMAGERGPKKILTHLRPSIGSEVALMLFTAQR